MDRTALHIRPALILAALGLPCMSGCTEHYRYLSAAHWHDRDTLVVAYTEYVRHHYVVTGTGRSSTHVLICKVLPDNSLVCHEQPELDGVLNAGHSACTTCAARTRGVQGSE